jgi:hypothetical protein
MIAFEIQESREPETHLIPESQVLPYTTIPASTIFTVHPSDLKAFNSIGDKTPLLPTEWFPLPVMKWIGSFLRRANVKLVSKRDFMLPSHHQAR